MATKICGQGNVSLLQLGEAGEKQESVPLRLEEAVVKRQEQEEGDAAGIVGRIHS